MKKTLIVSLLSSALLAAPFSYAQTDEVTPEPSDLAPLVVIEEVSDPELDFPRLEKIAEELSDAYEANEEEFLKRMLEDPIDYELVNSNLNTAAKTLSDNSELIKSVELTFDSVLTKAFHQRLGNAAYSLPFGATSLNAQVKLNPDANLPLPVEGFGLGIKVGQTAASLRGLINLDNFLVPSWTDTYAFVGYVDVDSLQAIKMLFAQKDVQEACENPSVLTGGTADLEDSEKFQEAIKELCIVVAKGSAASDFKSFLAEIKEPVEKIDDLISDIIDETFSDNVGEGLGGVLNFVTKAAYSYKVGVEDCESGLFPQRAKCEPNLFLKASGGAFIGDLDGDLVVTEKRIAVSLSGNFSSGARAAATADKKELAAYLYIAAKVVEAANNEELTQVGEELASSIEELAKDIQESVNEDVLELP